MKPEQLRRLIKDYRVPQYELAKLCGVSTTTVNNWCRRGTSNDAIDAGIEALLIKEYGRMPQCLQRP